MKDTDMDKIIYLTVGEKQSMGYFEDNSKPEGNSKIEMGYEIEVPENEEQCE